MAVGQFLGYAKWWILSKCGRKVPLVITIGIGYACNLRCRHCSIDAMLRANPGMKAALTYDEVVSDLRERFSQGARIAYFEGGETTMWRDGSRTLGDLIDAAHEIGFYNVGYTTNGTTGRIYTNSDVISVSLDGPKAVHDFVRGEGVYDRLMETLANLDFSGLVYANMVLQNGNLEYIRETADVVRDNKRFAGIVFNFITPPPYELLPSREDRLKAIAEIEALRKEGYPILNSTKGLRLLAEEDWSSKCPRYLSAFTLPDGSRKQGCPMEGTDSCRHCGYDAVREYYLVDRGSPSTIMEMFPVFARSKRSEEPEVADAQRHRRGDHEQDLGQHREPERVGDDHHVPVLRTGLHRPQHPRGQGEREEQQHVHVVEQDEHERQHVGRRHYGADRPDGALGPEADGEVDLPHLPVRVVRGHGVHEAHQPHHEADHHREHGHLCGDRPGGHVERAQRHHEERHRHGDLAEAVGPQVHRRGGVEPGQQHPDRPEDDHGEPGVEDHRDCQQHDDDADRPEYDPALPLGDQAGVELVPLPVQLPHGVGGHQVLLCAEPLVEHLRVYAGPVVEVVVGEVHQEGHEQHRCRYEHKYVPRHAVRDRADDAAHRGQQERQGVAESEDEVEPSQRGQLLLVRGVHGTAIGRLYIKR